MTILIQPIVVDVGLSPNDGSGDPLRDAFVSTNNNISNLHGFLAENPEFPALTVHGAAVTDSITANVATINQNMAILSNTISSSTTTGALIVTGGIGTRGDINVGGDLTVVGSINGDLHGSHIATGALVVTGDAAIAGTLGAIVAQITNDFDVGGNVSINGTLTVHGNVITITTSEFIVEHPMIQVGGVVDATLSSNDGKDRGIEFFWYDEAAHTQKQGFFGWDNATGKFTYVPNAVYSIGQEDVIIGNVGPAIFSTVEADIISSGTSTFNTLTAASLSVNGSITATAGINGTLLTNAQPNITSVGTLTGLDVLAGNITSLGSNVKVTNGSIYVNTGSIYINGIPVATSAEAFHGGTVSGDTIFTSVTSSTSAATGAVIVNGGLGVQGNLNVGGSLSTADFSALTLGGLLTSPNQYNITTVGTLSDLTVTGNTILNSLSLNNLIVTNSISASTINASTGLGGTLTTANQHNITAVGTLGSLTVTNNISAGSFTGPVTGNVTGNVSGSASTVTANAQPAITSVGALTSLGVTGTATVGNVIVNGLAQASGNVQSSQSVVGTYLYGQIMTPGQTQITSVGTLGSLSVNGLSTFFNNTTFAGGILASGAGSQAIGSTGNRFGIAYVAGINSSGTVTAGSFSGPYDGVIGNVTPNLGTFTSVNISAGNLNLNGATTGIKFRDGTFQTTAAGSNAAYSMTAANLVGGTDFAIPYQTTTANVTAFIPNSLTSGYILTANTNAAPTWAPAPTSIPSQGGNAGMFLATDGTNLSWAPASALSVDSAVFATVAGTVTIVNDSSTSSSVYPMWAASAGNVATHISSSNLSFKPSTGELTATKMSVNGAFNVNYNSTNTLNTGSAGGFISNYYTSATNSDTIAISLGYKPLLNVSNSSINPTAEVRLTSASTAGTGLSQIDLSIGGVNSAPTPKVSVSAAGVNVFGAVTATSSVSALSFNGDHNGNGSGLTNLPSTELSHNSVTIGTGTSLTGGGVVALGGNITLDMANVGTAVSTASFVKITTNDKGQVNFTTPVLGSDIVSTLASTPVNNANAAVTASVATSTTITSDGLTSSYVYPTWVNGTSGNLGHYVTNTLYFAPSIGTLYATKFSGSHAGSGSGLTGIPNGSLQNSNVTIGSTTINLGGTATTLVGLTNVTSTTFTGTASYATSASNAATANSATQVGTTITFTNTGAGDLTNTTYNGSTARVISYNTIGAYSAANPSGFITSAQAPVQSVGVTSPITNSGTTSAPIITLPAAAAAVSGYMTSTYAAKLDAIASGATNISNTNQLTNGAGFITSAGTATAFSSTSLNSQFNSVGIGSGALGVPSGTAGELRCTNNITAYYSSDERLKQDIAPIANALDKINQLSGNEFNWTDEYIKAHGGEDGYFVRRHDIGVIAQEVELVLPEAVADREDGYKGVKYDKLVPLLIQAVKELSANATNKPQMSVAADLAEMYQTDGQYEPGTVLIFGGTKEVTTTGHRADVSVAGVVSTTPAYLMNMDEPHAVAVALRGKVPVKVIGPVKKGDLLITSYVAGYAESVGTDGKFGIAVFAKSLSEDLSTGPKIINAVII